MGRFSNKIVVVGNVQHSLFPEQASLIREISLHRLGTEGAVEFLSAPAEGWSLQELKEIAKEFRTVALNNEELIIIFVSPIPALIKLVAEAKADTYEMVDYLVFHNDRREKLELPNGKIIQKISDTGWVLV